MVGKILEPEIKSMIDARNFGALREVFREWPPADVAEVILDVPEDEQVIVFRVLSHSLAADVFEFLDVDAQQQLLRAMAHEQVVAILNEMSPDDRTALLEEMPSAAARQLIRLLSPEERRVATALLGYPEDSVGRLMTPDFIAVKEDWTVQQVLDYVREHGRDSETLNVVYVVDDRGKLIDDLRIREFLLRPLDAKVSDFRDHTFVALNVIESQQDALNMFRKYDRAALPVVDSSGVRDSGWSLVRRSPRRDRHPARRAVVNRWREIFSPQFVRSALATGRLNCRVCACRRGALGLVLRLDAAICPAPRRRGSGDFVCAICRNTGRCHRAGHLFQHRVGHYAWCNAVTLPKSNGIAEVNALGYNLGVI